MPVYNPKYVPRYQAAAVLSQAAPVQNTWYTILPTTKDARILEIAVEVADTAEDIEIRLTIDGQVFVDAQAGAVAGTDYFVTRSFNPTTEYFILSTTSYAGSRAFLVEGRSVKVELRKTTNTGAGNLNGIVSYQKW